MAPADLPAIPGSTRSSIIPKLLDHAGQDRPQLAKVQATYHGSFAYITGVVPGGEQTPLFRLRYGGSAHSFGFATYSPARDRSTVSAADRVVLGTAAIHQPTLAVIALPCPGAFVSHQASHACTGIRPEASGRSGCRVRS